MQKFSIEAMARQQLTAARQSSAAREATEDSTLLLTAVPRNRGTT